MNLDVQLGVQISAERVKTHHIVASNSNSEISLNQTNLIESLIELETRPKGTCP